MNPPRLAIIGYGAMGREIEIQANALGYPVDSVFDINTTERLSADLLRNATVCIDFTQPDAVLSNTRVYAEAGIAVVMGTTGWSQHEGEVRHLVEEAGIGFLTGGNFSVGVHVLRLLARNAAALLEALPEYDISLHETHHVRKKDAPSGTALMLAQDILSTLPRKTEIRTHIEGAPAPSDLVVTSSRTGSVPGTHEILVDGPYDCIELRHLARDRRGFASGALKAAAWVSSRKGYFTIEEMFHDLIDA